MELNNIKVFIVILLAQITLAANEAGTTTLKSVHIIYRHGERSPDPSFATTTGGLTEKGKKQMYELGLYIRRRYSNLLKPSFDAAETQIISSDTDRTIRSAGLVAYGLYEDFNLAAKWNREDDAVPFEPIPVRAIPPELDQPKVPCPRLTQLTGTTATQYFDGLLGRHARLLNTYVKEMNDENFLNRDIDIDMRIVKFISFMEEAEFNSTHGLPLRDWTVKMMQLDDFRYLTIGLCKAYYKLPEERKLYGGSLLGLVTRGLQEENPKRLVLYSGHERIIFAFMSLLDIYDPYALRAPPLGASVMLELHQDSQSGRQREEHVKIFYRNDTQREALELKLPGCGYPCFLSYFLKNTQSLIPVDYERECQDRSPVL